MKKTYKVITVFLVILMITLTITNTSLAWGINEIDVNGTEEFSNVGNSIIKVLSIIGAIMSVVVLIVLGIKYMVGSLEERAQYKKTMLPYVIGAIFIFSASVIAQIIYDIAIELK